MENSKETKNKAEEKRELRCPFDKDLKCEDCRLYQAYPGGEGKKACVLILAGLNA